MSERDAATIRSEIAAERQRLDDTLTALEGELLSGLPFVVGGLVAAGALVLLTRRKQPRRRRGIRFSVRLD
jgi:hypothetical protein